MKRSYTTPRLVELGSLAQLTQYGTGAGATDTVYLANPAGTPAIGYFTTLLGGDVTGAQNIVAALIVTAGGAPDQATALNNLVAGRVTGGRGSLNPTVGSSFTL